MSGVGKRAALLITALAFCSLDSLSRMPAQAQMTPDQIEDPGPRNQVVERAYRLERLQSDVVYIKPSTPFTPDQSIRVAVPKPPPTRQERIQEMRWTWGLGFGLILALVIGIFIWQGARIGVRFRGTEDRKRATKSRVDDDARDWQDLPPDGLFDRIAQMKDRRAALILLTSRALQRAAEANGLHLGRAQTARDVVRVIPSGWQHREPLGQLVRETEIVHFGGRDLPEDRWQICLDLARPIFGQSTLVSS